MSVTMVAATLSSNDDIMALVSGETAQLELLLLFGWFGSISASANPKVLALHLLARIHGSMLLLLSLRICGVCRCMAIFVLFRDNIGWAAVIRDGVVRMGCFLAVATIEGPYPVTSPKYDYLLVWLRLLWFHRKLANGSAASLQHSVRVF